MAQDEEVLSIKSQIQRKIMDWPDFREFIYTFDMNLGEIKHLGKLWLTDLDVSQLEKIDREIKKQTGNLEKGLTFFVALYKSWDTYHYFVLYANYPPIKMLKKVKIV